MTQATTSHQRLSNASSPQRIKAWAAVLCLPLLACAAPADTVLRASETSNAPPGADPNACYARQVTPAIVETVTEQVLVQPPQISATGAVNYPATYRTETRQEIVRERTELWFETLCEDLLSPDFIETLQRALAARGFYSAQTTGVIDRNTRRAILAYQTSEDLHSDVLSLAAARQLGLSELPRQE